MENPRRVQRLLGLQDGKDAGGGTAFDKAGIKSIKRAERGAQP